MMAGGLNDRRVVGPGFELIIATGSVSNKVRSALRSGLRRIGQNYLERIRETISLDDHTLQELRKLGHPYALGGSPVHADDRMVHEQTGELKESIKLSPVDEGEGRRLSVYVTSSSPYMPFLIYGTSTMRPRRFHEKAYEEIKGTLWDPIKKELAAVKHKIDIKGRGR